MAVDHGRPPAWIDDAAGSELWAFYKVTTFNIFIPVVVTDCLGIVQGLQDGPDASTHSSKRLARTWSMIAHNLDNDFTQACLRVKWKCSTKLQLEDSQVVLR